MELSVTKANVNVEDGTVTITGYDVADVISEIGTEELLKQMDYSDILDFVAEVEKEKADEEEDHRKLTLGE